MNKNNYDARILQNVKEIRDLVDDLPIWKKHRIINRLQKISSLSRRPYMRGDSRQLSLDLPEGPEANEQTQLQIGDRYIAKKAIYEAMLGGRKVSLEDSRHFRVSEMHTQIHCIREDIKKKDLPVVLHSRWRETGLLGKRIKEYWLEPKEGGVQC